MRRVVLISLLRSTVLFGKRSSFQPTRLRSLSLLPMIMRSLWSQVLLTTVYNCAQIKLTTPRYGGSLWEMVLSIPTGDSHDQEQDSEYHTRISKPRKVHSRHRDHLGHSQEHGAQIPAPPRTGRHAPSASQSSFQARSVQGTNQEVDRGRSLLQL